MPAVCSAGECERILLYLPELPMFCLAIEEGQIVGRDVLLKGQHLDTRLPQVIGPFLHCLQTVDRDVILVPKYRTPLDDW